MSRILLLVLLFQTSFCFPQKSPAEQLLIQGAQLYTTGNYAQSIPLLEKSILLSKQSNELQVLGKAYNNLGNAFSQIGKSEQALSNFFLSIAISKKVNDNLNIAKTYKNIGALYSEQKDFSTAMQYYDNAYSQAKQINEIGLMADCLNNKGVVYEQQLLYDKAQQVYSAALKIYRSRQDEQKISMVLNNLAIVYKYLRNYPQSIAYYQAALSLSAKLDDKFMIAANQNNLANVYALTGNYPKALELLLLANRNAQQIKAIEVIVESYAGIADAYEKLGNFTQAIAFRKRYEQENANYISTERAGQLAEMQTKYETTKKEDEIKLLQQQGKINTFEIAKQKFQIDRRNQLIILFLLILAGLISIAYFWETKRKWRNRLALEKAMRETEEQERLRIARDIHDDLGSGLSKINFLSEIIFQKTAHLPDVRTSSESVKETAVSIIDNMRDLIWALNPENTNLGNLIARMREYSTDFLEDSTIQIAYDIPEKLPQTPINKESHRALLMVVKETLNNSYKHSKATKVTFAVALSPATLNIIITDNGIGFNTQTNKKNNGLNNMPARLAAIGGKFTLSSQPNQGTTVNIEVPLTKIFKS